MKNKLIFRILGALASALIIVSVFVPFVNVTGYSTSLWESFQTTLYLPIMIIAFGAIGVIFFSLNIKTEFAYMSTGAITFFLVMRTIDILDQNAFNTLSVGYYFLVTGTLLTGIMAFLTNLKTKEKKEEIVENVQNNQPTMLDQIDKLYNDQTTVENQISPIQPVDSVVEPIPVQPIEIVTPVQPLENQQIVENVEPQQVIQESIKQENISLQEQLVPEDNIQIQMEPQQKLDNINQVPVNPVLQEFAAENPVNPVINEFATEQVVQLNPVIQEFTSSTQNPVLQEFSNPTPQETTQPIIQSQPISESVVKNETSINSENHIPVNPVVNEFLNPGYPEIPKQSNDLDIFG